MLGSIFGKSNDEPDPYVSASEKDIAANRETLERLKGLNAQSQGVLLLREHFQRLEKEGRGM